MQLGTEGPAVTLSRGSAPSQTTVPRHPKQSRQCQAPRCQKKVGAQVAGQVTSVRGAEVALCRARSALAGGEHSPSSLGTHCPT